MTRDYSLVIVDRKMYLNNDLFYPLHHHKIRRAIFTQSASEAEVIVASAQPDLIIVDIDCDLHERIGFFNQMTKNHENIKPMALTRNRSFQYFPLVACTGVKGFLLADASPDLSFHAIQQMFSMGSFIHPKLAPAFLETMVKNINKKEESTILSPREFDVLSCIARGHTSAKTAKSLGISNHTVGSHIKNIYRKLSIHSKGEAILAAIRFGLLQVGKVSSQ